MSPSELEEAESILAELVAPMCEERAPGVAFWGFYLQGSKLDLENDEVLDRFRIGRGVYAVELVWNEDLDLEQRGEGCVVRTIHELRALRRRAGEIADGMEHTRRNLRANPIPPPSAGKQTRSASAWIATRARRDDS